ncbi:MAG: hypothetical protein LPK24_00805 [Marinobacter sp.]|uniref:hypothetical protein n=1 Tax=Marinobacter sp. TaxID=50741 RepID=UPI0029C5D89E|nr:hypothetical protein [Marinobacter sp.]MDX5385054.1 hypothetical protein [Marinobacter sp.]
MMRKLDIPYIVYMVGILSFAVFYYQVKEQFENQWLFVGVAVAYLAFVRLIGHLAAKWMRSRNKTDS